MQNKSLRAREIEKKFYQKAFEWNVTDRRKGGLGKKVMHSIYSASLRKRGSNEKGKSFGGQVVFNKRTGKNEFRRIRGQIKETKLAQIEAYDPTEVDKNENERTLLQQAVDKAWRDRYNSVDIFQRIKELGITEYDPSEGTYVDPVTGETRYLEELAWM